MGKVTRWTLRVINQFFSAEGFQGNRVTCYAGPMAGPPRYGICTFAGETESNFSGFGQTSGNGGFSAAPSDKRVFPQRFRRSGGGFGKELLKEQTPITGSGYISALKKDVDFKTVSPREA